jgi:hypothetical protein
MTDTDTAAFLDRLEALHAQATPGPWSQHPSDGEYVIAGVTDNDGEFDYAVDVCDTYTFRKANPAADAAAIVAAVNALPLLVAAVRAAYALAEAWETDHADWCCQRGCPNFHGIHPGDVEFTTEGGIEQIGPDFPCPGMCTCFVGPFRDGLRAALDEALEAGR